MTPWPDWEADARARAETERRHQDRQHHTIAQLLRTRDLPQAAMVAAIARYSTNQVDNWDGGQFEAVFAVPPAHYDAVDDEMREALTAAARDVIGAVHFAGICVQVALADAESGWGAALIQELRELLVEQHREPGDGTLRALP